MAKPSSLRSLLFSCSVFERLCTEFACVIWSFRDDLAKMWNKLFSFWACEECRFWKFVAASHRDACTVNIVRDTNMNTKMNWMERSGHGRAEFVFSIDSIDSMHSPMFSMQLLMSALFSDRQVFTNHDFCAFLDPPFLFYFFFFFSWFFDSFLAWWCVLSTFSHFNIAKTTSIKYIHIERQDRIAGRGQQHIPPTKLYTQYMRMPDEMHMLSHSLTLKLTFPLKHKHTAIKSFSLSYHKAISQKWILAVFLWISRTLNAHLEFYDNAFSNLTKILADTTLWSEIMLEIGFSMEKLHSSWISRN